MKQAKKLLSFVLALTMVMALFSGVVLFNTSAAKDELVLMPMAGLDQYTADELAKFIIVEGSAVQLTKDDAGHTVINGAVKTGSWNSSIYFSPTTSYDQWSKNPLVNPDKPLFDLDLSNKLGLYIKVNSTGTNDFKANGGKVWFTYGSTTQAVAIDSKDNACSVVGDYYFIDFSKAEIVGAGWYDYCKQWSDSYYGIIDEAKIGFILPKDIAADKKNYSMSIEMYAVGYTDTVELGKQIVAAKKAIADGTKVNADILANAEAVYKDSANKDQSKVDAAVKALKEELSPYEFLTLPGIQNWGDSEMTVYNEQAALKKGKSGTPGELVNDHLVGGATQALKLKMGGMPNDWTVAFSTCGNVSNEEAKSQIGDIFGGRKVKDLAEYEGIRIAVVNENGEKPSLDTWDKTNPHIVSMKLYGSEVKAWSNQWYPIGSIDTKEKPDYTAVYEDGYYYFFFKDIKGGWGENSETFFANQANNTYGNFYFWLQNGGLNNKNYNGGAIYISEMQLFRDKFFYDISDLNEDDYTAESWAALEKAIADKNYTACDAARAALVHKIFGAATPNFFEGWTTTNVNEVVTVNSDKIGASINGEALAYANQWRNCDFTNNTVYTADNSIAMEATEDKTSKTMGWKSMDRKGTLAVAAGAGYPAMTLTGIKDTSAFHINVKATGTYTRGLVGFSNCASNSILSGSYEMYYFFNASDVPADGNLIIPWGDFEKAWWANAFAKDQLDQMEVFICEIYGAANGTKVTFSEAYGYGEADVSAYKNLWQYNYTAQSWEVFQNAFATYSEDAIKAAAAALKPAETDAVTGNLMSGWTTTNVNEVVTVNSDKIGDSINGEALAYEGQWRNCDFTANTEYTADGNFAMKAKEDKTSKTMGWKSMDRKGTLATQANGGYPEMDLTSIKASDGIRVKIDVEGSVKRLLIGFSNCAFGGNREMYAFIKPEYIGADGYINIPWSKFEKAWWCDAFTKDNLNEAIVWICEAYGAENNTVVTFSDMHGYIDLQTYTADMFDLGFDGFKPINKAAAKNDAVGHDAKVVMEDNGLEAIVVDGTNGWVTKAITDADYSAMEKGFTAEAIFNTNEESYEGAIISVCNGGGWALEVEDNNLKIYHRLLTDKYATIPGVPVAANAWYHAVYTFDGANVKVYLNGELKSTTAVDGLKFNTKVNQIGIGGQPKADGTAGCKFRGDIASAKVYSKPINAQQVKDNYDAYIASLAAFADDPYWEDNYTAASWNNYLEARANGNENAADLLVPATLLNVTGNMFEGWTTTNVNEVVTENASHLGDSVLGEGLDTAKDVWKNCDFTNNTEFTADNNFSIKALESFEGKTMCWKNMDRSGTLAGTANHGYPALTLANITKSEGLHVKIDVSEGGSFDRILLGFSTCTADSGLGSTEMYALNITKDIVDANGFVNIPWSYFTKCWWANAFTQEQLDKIEVFIVEVYNATKDTKVTFSDVYAYSVDTTVHGLWQYNYTEDSWKAYEEAVATKDIDLIKAAEEELVEIATMKTTGDLFEGWTDDNVNEVVEVNSDHLGDSVLGEGLDTAQNVWKNCDFTNNTTFAADNNFSIKAAESFEGKTMCWKNMDRSGLLAGTANHGYPALNKEGLDKSEGLHVKINVNNGGKFGRILLGFSTCTADSGLGNREMYALNITQENVEANGDLLIPWSYFGKCWWCDAFTQAELSKVEVFIVEVFDATKGTEVTISDVYGYVGAIETADLWEYNYTAESWAAYKDALKSQNALKIEEAVANLEVIDTIALTGNMFEGWTTTNVNEVVTANSDKLGDSVLGDGLDVANQWKNCDFTNNTTFTADNSFVMTAAESFEGKTMCWKNMDRSGTLTTANHGYPALNIDGIKGSDGIRVKLAIDGSVTRILLGFSNCAKDNGIGGNKEMYALNITADSVAKDGYVTIPWSCFGKCWWTDAFTADQLNKIEVFIIEAFNATKGTSVAINDMYAYKQVADVTAEELAELKRAADALEAFDIDGRYADIIADARLLDETSKNYYVDNAYKALVEVLEAFGDPQFGAVAVPGYSIYTQEEMNQFEGRNGTWKFTKTDNGMKVSLKSGSGYTFANGAYGAATGTGNTGEGYSMGDTTYGPVKAVGGKNFIDMLGGYSLSDIYAFRFKIEGGGAYIAIQYKDGVGLWNGMVTPSQTIYIAKDGYYTFKTSGIPTGQLDGWYAGKWTRDELRAMTKYILMDASANYNKNIYGWEVILYETIDRAALKQALLTPGAKEAASYQDALDTYYDEYADEYDVSDAAELLAYEIALTEAGKYWEYNYTAESWKAFQSAVDSADYAEDIAEAISLLVPVETRAVTGNLFEGWTTTNINEVVTENSSHLGDSVLGEGLDTAQNVWKNCDFTNNTTFAGDNSFAMTATASFEGKTMCWKNMDRSGTLAGTANHGYPALNLEGIKDSDGIRVKLAVEGSVTRILLGFSTCTADSGLGNKEMYALNITADSVAADGYVTIPWSYFGKCWWADAFTQNELDKMQVFIIEAYNATEGTTVSIDDIYGYEVILPATEAQLAELAAVIATVEDFDFDGKFAANLVDAKALLKGAYDYQVADAIDAVQAIIDECQIKTLDRAALKANLLALADATPDEYKATYESSYTAYYAAKTQEAIDDAAFALQRIIDKPATPVIEVAEVTATTIEIAPIAGGEYRIDGGDWTDNNVFEVELANTEYTVEARIAETDAAIASDIAEKVITTELGSFADATVVVSGTERYLETLTADVLDVPAEIGDYTITWFRSPDVEIGTGATYTVAAEDIGYALFAVVTSENAYDQVVGDDTGVIGKATIKDYTLPTASEIQYPQTLADSILTGGSAEIEGTWQWVAPETQPVSAQSGNAFDVVFVPSEAYADLYDALQAKVSVVINRAPYEPTVFSDDQTGLIVEGEFMYDTAIELQDITYDQSAYLALLRASAKDNSGLKKLVLFKTVDFTVGGEEVAEPYNKDVDLVVKSFVGENRANETFSVWFFIDGQVVNYVGEVDANGVLSVVGVEF